MLRIGELAKQFNITADTLRFYEKEGLLTASVRTAAGYRMYNEADQQRLDFILRCKRLGYSLTQTQDLLALEISGEPQASELLKAQLQTHLQDVAQRMSELEALRHGLMQLAAANAGFSNQPLTLLDAWSGKLLDTENNAR